GWAGRWEQKGIQKGKQEDKQEVIQTLAEVSRSGKTLEEAIQILGMDSADRPQAGRGKTS
ncbi:MAG: hypothetical protein LBU17_05755, partial [Treponema sp.]|nr:hypothetical protein [Treponema sp.]